MGHYVIECNAKILISKSAIGLSSECSVPRSSAELVAS